MGRGSIPLHVLCFGGLLTFIALWGLAYAFALSTSNGRETHISKETVRKAETPNLRMASAMNTIWVIGTGAWSGAALSGQALTARRGRMQARFLQAAQSAKKPCVGELVTKAQAGHGKVRGPCDAEVE